MKAHLKPLCIVLTVLVCAAALVLGVYFWITRPVSFSSMFPMTPEDVSFCHVILHTQQEGSSDHKNITLTQEQMEELLHRLSTSKYRLNAPSLLFSGDMVRVTISPHARLTFSRKNGQPGELTLAGEYIRVALPAFSSRSRLYIPEEGISFQEEIIGYLQSCLSPVS